MRTQLMPADASFIATDVEKEMRFVQSVIETLRTIRSEMGIAPSKDITLIMRLGFTRSPESIQRYEGYLQRLARVKSLTFAAENARPKLSASAVVEGEELFVPLEGLIDIEVERQRLQKEIDRVSGLLDGVRRKLENESFVARAPKDVVDKEREKLDAFTQTVEKLEKSLEMLKG